MIITTQNHSAIEKGEALKTTETAKKEKERDSDRFACEKSRSMNAKCDEEEDLVEGARTLLRDRDIDTISFKICRSSTH